MASGKSWLFFSYNSKLANKDPDHKELVILGIPCSPLSHNYYIEPIKGSVVREIFMPVHRFSVCFTAQHLLSTLHKFVTASFKTVYFRVGRDIAVCPAWHLDTRPTPTRITPQRRLLKQVPRNPVNRILKAAGPNEALERGKDCNQSERTRCILSLTTTTTTTRL